MKRGGWEKHNLKLQEVIVKIMLNPLKCLYQILCTYVLIYHFVSFKVATSTSPNKGKKLGKKRNPWSESDESAGEISDLSDEDMGESFIAPVRDRGPRRVAGMFWIICYCIEMKHALNIIYILTEIVFNISDFRKALHFNSIFIYLCFQLEH